MSLLWIFFILGPMNQLIALSTTNPMNNWDYDEAILCIPTQRATPQRRILHKLFVSCVFLEHEIKE